MPSLNSEGVALSPLHSLPCPPQPLPGFLSGPHVPQQQNKDIGFARAPLCFPRACADQVYVPLQRALGAVGCSLSTDYSLMLTFIYGGHVVGEAQVQSLDCRLVAEPSSSQCSMEQVVFPKPSAQGATQRLLSQLERGVLVASNSRGLFVQRLCPIRISYSAPEFPPGPGPHLLPSNECVELFKTAHFCRGEVAAAQLLTTPPISPPCTLPLAANPPSLSMDGTLHIL